MAGVTLNDFIVPRRGRTSSGNHNKHFSDIQIDLLSAFKGIQNLDNRLLKFLRNLNFQNQALESLIDQREVETNVANLQFNALNNSKLLFTSFWSSAAVSNINTLRHDFVHGQITLDIINSWSHIPVIRNVNNRLTPADGVIIRTLDLFTDTPIDANPIEVSRPNDVYNAVNKSPLDIWIETTPVQADTISQRIGVLLEVEIPSPISPTVNTMVIHPFPFLATNMRNASFITAGGSFTDVPGFPTLGIASRNTAWHFGSVNHGNKFRLRLLHASSMVDEEFNEVKPLGLQNLDFGFTEFQEEGNCVIKLEAPSAEISFITSFNASTNVYTVQSVNENDFIWFEIFKEEALITKVYDSRTNIYPLTQSDAPIDVRVAGSPLEELWIRVNMNRVHSTTPALKDILITYT